VTGILNSAINLSFEDLILHPIHPWGISYGTTTANHNILVRLRYGDHIGLGEAAPRQYHDESPESVKKQLEKWQRENILGSDPFAILQICTRLDARSEGIKHSAARAAVEMALYDLIGKISNAPTYKMLGLSKLPLPPTSFTIGIDDLDLVEKKTAEAIAAGFKILKVKLGTTYDRAIVESVRRVAPKVPLQVDANGAWDAKEAIAKSHFFAEHGIRFMEQPLSKNARVEEFAQLKKQSQVPVFVDESVSNSADVLKFAGAVDGVVIKLAKTGGMMLALSAIQAARTNSLQIMFGCMIESSVGIAAACQLAGLADYADLDGALLLADDPFVGPTLDNGCLQLSNRPGLGVVAKGK
jgi:L-alanine-DL-glutamate epimerase-like enolase superfamily enzyme